MFAPTAPVLFIHRYTPPDYSTVTDLARFLGLSTSSPFATADIVSQQLQRHDGQTGREMLVGLRHIHREICRIFNIIVAIEGHGHQISTTAAHLDQIADRLLIEVTLLSARRQPAYHPRSD